MKTLYEKVEKFRDEVQKSWHRQGRDVGSNAGTVCARCRQGLDAGGPERLELITDGVMGVFAPEFAGNFYEGDLCLTRSYQKATREILVPKMKDIKPETRERWRSLPYQLDEITKVNSSRLKKVLAGGHIKSIKADETGKGPLFFETDNSDVKFVLMPLAF